MKIQYSDLLGNNPEKDIFDKIDDKVLELKNKGIEVIDLGVGDPAKNTPPPDYIIQSLTQFAEQAKLSGYPGCKGNEIFRKTCANYMKNEFNVALNPDTEINLTIGSKEAVYHFPKVIVNPNDVIICPTPGYPPFHLGTKAAYGIPYFVPLYEENNFLIDFEKIPNDITQKAKMIWINYPNSPTGKSAPYEWYEKLINWTHKHNIIIAADEGAYIELYFDKKPHSILEITKEGIIAFYSLSKRNNMTEYRIGFAAGDAQIIEGFNKLKNRQDDGSPNFIQHAAILALNDTKYVENLRKSYQVKRQILIDAFVEKGLPRTQSDSTFFIWQKTPKGMTGTELAERLLEIGIIVMPGTALTQPVSGKNPGEDFIRIALMPTLKDIKKAAQRIHKALKI